MDPLDPRERRGFGWSRYSLDDLSPFPEFAAPIKATSAVRQVVTPYQTSSVPRSMGHEAATAPPAAKQRPSQLVVQRKSCPKDPTPKALVRTPLGEAHQVHEPAQRPERNGARSSPKASISRNQALPQQLGLINKLIKKSGPNQSFQGYPFF